MLALLAVTVASGCGGDSTADLPNAFVVVRSQDNPIIPSTDTFTEIVRLTLEPGRYEVAGKVELHNRDGLPFNTQCELVPSNPDGTAAEIGALGSDAAFRHLAPSGGPGELGGFVLFVSQELSASGSVVLGCSGSGNEHGAFASYASIRAIEVGAVTGENFTP